MKRLFFFYIFFLLCSSISNAQNTNIVRNTDYLLQIEDSDKITSSDYYSGKTAVRTGLEVYNLFWYNGGVCMNNSQNKLVGRGEELQYDPVDKRTGEAVDLFYARVLTFDSATINSISREVFPNCDIAVQKSKKYIELYVSIDMNTYKVIDMAISLPYSNTDKSLLSIPPSKIKQLEKLIKERCKGEFRETDPMLTERTRNSSYAIARYFIYFSKFSL